MKKELVVLAAIASIILVSATVFAQVYPEGIVSYWKFDEGSGITAFDSVGTNDGTLVNGPVWTTGQVDGALNFGGSDYVKILNTAALNPEHITLEAWVYPTSIGYYRSMISKQPTAGFAYPWGVYILGLSGNTAKPYLHIAISDIAYSVGADEEIPLNEWTHLAGTYDGETLKLYVNGVLVKDETSPSGPIDGSPQPVYIGKPPSNHYYYGKLDEVAIYNRALSAEEIQQHYQNGLNGLGYEELVVPATIDINPDTLNVKSNGEWITAYIELPEDYNVCDIEVSTINLDSIPVDQSAPATIGDYDSDGISDLMVKFDRTAVVAYLGTEDVTEDETGTDYYEELTITGELTDRTPFEGSDTIRVIDKGKSK